MKAEEQKGQKTKINKQMTKRYPVCYMLHNHTSFHFAHSIHFLLLLSMLSVF